MIEEEFPRINYPEVYQSLLAIHEAQTRSVQLIHSVEVLTEKETLQICMAKGGASVLANGYLVAGRLSKEQEFFLFGGQHIDVFQSLMRKSMDLFIMDAIAQNPDCYSKKFVVEMENHSPFSFLYIQKKKKRFAPYNGLLLTAIREIAFNGYVNDNNPI